jgi:hypothetical protein
LRVYDSHATVHIKSQLHRNDAEPVACSSEIETILPLPATARRNHRRIAGSRIVGLIGNLNGTILLTLEWRRTNSALIDLPMNTANELKRALIGQHKPPTRRLVSSVSS